MKLGRPEAGEELEVESERAGGSRILMLVVLGILLAVGAWALYANFRPNRPAMDMNMRVTSGSTPFPVVVVPVERGAISGVVVYTGSVAAFNEEDIYPRVTGRIVDMLVYPGDAVRAGQVLARLDSVELSSRLREAEAALAAARAGRVQMEKELAMAEAEAGYARGVAARTERLFNTGAVSRQENESDSALAATAEAKLEAARAKLHVAGALLAQGEAASHTATILRNYSDIVSSTSGYVVKRLVAPGVLVQPGTVILKVAQIDKVRLQANVGEKDFGSIRIGSPVWVATAASGQPLLAATVSAVFPSVEQGSRTAVVEALVDNAARRLLPGQYVTMQFSTGQREQAVIIPAPTVVRMGDKATVWVVKDGRAEPRSIVTGLQSADRVEVVEGLSGGERLVARGQEGLYAGANVSEVAGTPRPPAPAAGPQREPSAVPGMPATPDMKDMPGMKPPTEIPTKPEEGSHAGH